MNIHKIILAAVLLSALQPFSPSALSSTAPADALAQAQKLLAQLTPDERFKMASGGNSFGISAIPRLGIPEVKFTDASAGVRDFSLNNGHKSKTYEKTTAFPCTLALAATWEPKLAAAYASAIGEEMRAGGIHVLLGPGMNNYRLSVNGRNFEYLGEDPFLASRIVENYVRGLQAQGVAATLKHFIGNESEHYRIGSNSIIDERALNEIYLPPFKAGIDAGAWAVMTSYNQFNGEWAAQNSALITGILRGQLGFQWLCMTDWGSTWDGVKFAASGNDLEKPAGWAMRRDRAKLLGTPEVDRMALSILKTCIAAGFYEPNFARPELMSRWKQRAAVARAVNDRAITLLQNNGILPLDPATGGTTSVSSASITSVSSATIASVSSATIASVSSATILVTGNCATREELSGGGSGHVKGYDNKTYAQAMRELFSATAATPAPVGAAAPIQNPESKIQNPITIAPAPTDAQIKAATLILIFPGFPLEGKDKEREGSNRPFVLPDDALIRRCVALNPKTIVCLIAGGGVEMDWAPKAAAILHAYYGGQTGADALADVLSGKTNPSGKLPFTIEKKFSDSPGYGYDRKPPEITASYPVAMVNDPPGTKDPKNRAGTFLNHANKTIIDIFAIRYKEGVFTGYRWYDDKKIAPRFPFGHGLSYTTFSYSDLHITKTPSPAGNIRATFTLKNTGSRAGDEVAQLYSSENAPVVPRPPRELKGFQRVTLAPGESKTITIEVPPTALGYWDTATHAWKTPPGDYTLSVGSSSRDLPLTGSITL